MNIFPDIKLYKTCINLQSIERLILYLLFVLTDDFYGFGTIYSNKTPSTIDYQWLDYRFGIFSFIIILFGAITAFIRKDKLILPVIFLFVIREFVFFVTTSNNCISEGSYEIYLSLIFAFLMISIVLNANQTMEEKELFILRAIFLNILIVYISLAMNLNKIPNRYNAPNMDVEATGAMCGIAFLFCLFNNRLKYKFLLSIFAFGGIVLSGSRTSWIIAMIIAVIGILLMIVRNEKINPYVLNTIAIIITLIIILSSVAIILIAIFNINIRIINESEIIARMVDTLDSSNMKNDSSFQGRMLSISIGFKIIEKNIFGISGYVTNLQIETQKYGFDTFPHSTLLVYYILLGPIVIALIFWMIYTIQRAYKKKLVYFLTTLYTFAFLCATGAPIVSFKPIFFYLFIFMLANESTCEYSDKRNRTKLQNRYNGIAKRLS